MRIGAHPGMQTRAMQCDTDLLGLGAAAGVGKTRLLNLLTTLWTTRRLPGNLITFRRNANDLTDVGCIVDDAKEIFMPLGAHFKRPDGRPIFSWSHPGGMLQHEFAHLHESDAAEKYDGPAFGLIVIDEVQKCLLRHVEHLMSRNRVRKGIGYQPLFRLSLNPVPTGWLRHLFDWWIGTDGFPIREREGAIRWFHREDNDSDNAFFVGTKEEIAHRFDEDPDDPEMEPMSITFIPGRPEDNPTQDWRSYNRRLRNLPKHKRDALMHGNWNSVPDDPTLIWDFPLSALFDDDDADFQDLLHSPGELEWFGMWDFGTVKALAWNVGILAPGAPPVLYIVAGKLWEHGDPVRAAKDVRVILRRLEHELGIEIDPRRVKHAGDPSGEQGDGWDGWATTLRSHGINISDIHHIVQGRAQRRTYVNSQHGIAVRKQLVQDAMNEGRLRFRKDPHTAIVVTSVRTWRWDVPEGTRLVDATNAAVRPQKGWQSHICEALEYGLALVYSHIQSRRATASKPPPVYSPPPRPGIMGGPSLPAP